MAAKTCAKVLKFNQRIFASRGIFTLCRTVRDTPQITSCSKRNFNTQIIDQCVGETEKDKGYWRVVTGVCVERLPIITPDLTELEKRYKTLQEQYEYRNSRLSDYEVEEKKLQERWKATNKSDEEELELIRLDELLKEAEEEDEEELRSFVLASRITQADKENDQKSLQRQLDKSLILLVKENSDRWRVPEAEVLQNESLRQAVNRHLDSSCGGVSKFRTLSNAPSGVYLDTESKPLKSKVFFHKTQLNNSKGISLDKKYTDFVWVTKDELKDFVEGNYLQALSKCLY